MGRHSLSTLSEDKVECSTPQTNMWVWDKGVGPPSVDRRSPPWQQVLRFEGATSGPELTDDSHQYLLPPATPAQATGLLRSVLFGTSKLRPIIVAINTQHFPVRVEKHTEIGFSILDTRAIENVPPGPYCENWLHHVRTRHLRIWDNGTWITYGVDETKTEKLWNGNQFLFGNSEWISKSDVKQIIQYELFKFDGPKMRDIVLVGHEWHKQEKFFGSLCRVIKEDAPSAPVIFSFADFPNIQGAIDTQILCAGHDGYKYTLTELCKELGISELVRHNGGNDAFYTMMVLLRSAAGEHATHPRALGNDAMLTTFPFPTAADMMCRIQNHYARMHPPPGHDNRCTACGRHGHKETECVWLVECSQCSKNGFCQHRPKPNDDANQQAPLVQMMSTLPPNLSAATPFGGNPMIGDPTEVRRNSNPFWPATHAGEPAQPVQPTVGMDNGRSVSNGSQYPAADSPLDGLSTQLAQCGITSSFPSMQADGDALPGLGASVAPADPEEVAIRSEWRKYLPAEVPKTDFDKTQLLASFTKSKVADAASRRSSSASWKGYPYGTPHRSSGLFNNSPSPTFAQLVPNTPTRIRTACGLTPIGQPLALPNAVRPTRSASNFQLMPAMTPVMEHTQDLASAPSTHPGFPQFRDRSDTQSSLPYYHSGHHNTPSRSSFPRFSDPVTWSSPPSAAQAFIGTIPGLGFTPSGTNASGSMDRVSGDIMASMTSTASMADPFVAAAHPPIPLGIGAPGLVCPTCNNHFRVSPKCSDTFCDMAGATHEEVRARMH